jgi:LuxR family maltose regulon positive regulatory protein
MLQAPQPPPPEALLTALINDIAATPTLFVLVIDDYHVIQTLAIHQQLVFLLEHLPSQMHVVLISREDPPFPLSRLRARGQMTDIRQADLRFTQEETRDFAKRMMQVALSNDDITALHASTEGWVTGLQFAALSMRQHSDVPRLLQSLTGDNRYILDYLMDEVFYQQSAEVQDFLLKTSVLERFSAPLCDAVTEHKDSNEILLALERSNLFIVPLDEVRQWYRYHHLFGDLLRHRLETRLPDRVRTLHIQAAQWFADNGFPEDAVRHALAAADWPRAAELISSGPATDLLRRSETTTLRRWIETIPDTFICSHLQLCVDYAWALILTEQLDVAEAYLARAEQMAQSTGAATDAFLGGIAAAHVHIARVRGDHARVVELSEKALALLPEDALSERSIVALNLGITQWFAGQLDKAETALKEAERTGRGSENMSAWLVALVFQGRILAARGKPQEAADLCHQIVEQGAQVSMACLAHFDLARLLYEWNMLDAAADYAQKGIALNFQGGNLEVQVGGLGILALIRQAQGDTLAAQAALDKTTQLLGEADISPPTRLYNLVMRLLIALAKGDLEAASRIAAQAPPPQEAGSFPDLLFLMLAQTRLFLVLDQRDKAAGLLAHLCGMAQSRGWHGTAIQARVLQALVAPNQEEALAILTEALAQAEPLNYIRTFVDNGQPMADLLRLAAARGVAPDYVHKLLIAFDTGLPATESEVEPPPKIQSPKSELVEPLSDREIDVLHWLVEGLTNQEIAQTMHVSVNTVKTHLKNIYGKLGVHNRKRAITQAEKLGLL